MSDGANMKQNRNVHVLIVLQTCSWKSKMENVVKYDVDLDILLMGSFM